MLSNLAHTWRVRFSASQISFDELVADHLARVWVNMGVTTNSTTLWEWGMNMGDP